MIKVAPVNKILTQKFTKIKFIAKITEISSQKIYLHYECQKTN